MMQKIMSGTIFFLVMMGVIYMSTTNFDLEIVCFCFVV